VTETLESDNPAQPASSARRGPIRPEAPLRRRLSGGNRGRAPRQGAGTAADDARFVE